MSYQKHINERGLLMEKIITDIYGIMNHSSNPNRDRKENPELYVGYFFRDYGRDFRKINQTIKEKISARVESPTQ
jgi:hypothetical protein